MGSKKSTVAPASIRIFLNFNVGKICAIWRVCDSPSAFGAYNDAARTVHRRSYRTVIPIFGNLQEITRIVSRVLCKLEE